MRKDIRIFFIDTCGWIISLTIIVFFFTLWLFSYNEVASPLKEAWTITFSAFSAFVTFGAATIAAYFVHDWKKQHNLQILAHEAKAAFHLYHNQRDIIHNFKYRIEGLINNNYVPYISEYTIANDFKQKFINVYNQDKEKLSSFCYLSEGQDLYNITTKYHEKIQDIANILATKANRSFSSTRNLNGSSSPEFLQLFESLEDENSKVLNGLKLYIFFN